MGYDNVKTAEVLTLMQICDFFGRLCVTFIADKMQKCFEHARHVIYIFGTLGTGTCMMFLRSTTTEAEIYINCALMGLFARYVTCSCISINNMCMSRKLQGNLVCFTDLQSDQESHLVSFRVLQGLPECSRVL